MDAWHLSVEFIAPFLNFTFLCGHQKHKRYLATSVLSV